MIRLPIGAGSLLVGSVALGLALAPVTGFEDGLLRVVIAALFLAVASVACRRLQLPAGRFFTALGIGLIALLAGLGLGQLRLAAIDAGAFDAEIGETVTVKGHLISPPQSDKRQIRMHLAGPQGRLAIFADRDTSGLPAPSQTLPVGLGVTAEGPVASPPEYLRQYLRRQGIRLVLKAERIEIGPPRGGIAGLLDGIRERALAGMALGMPPREAALAGGFVLGQDGAIDAATEENFRRAGLAHLVAASGQNVMLLVLLGSVPLVVAGLHLRRRVPILVGLVLLYVPLAGAGPSIQRAAIMGVVMLAMLWLGGAGPRLFGLLVAAALTLAVNPRASGDVGWQLSFAATLGIMLLSGDLRRLLLTAGFLTGNSDARGARASPLRRIFADGVAVTVAATLATAPLVAHHFGNLPLGSLSANLLALPAVAPVMWLGMIAGIAGQLPGMPTEAINWVNAVLIAYIAEVAAAVSDLPGAVIKVRLGSGWFVTLIELGLLASVRVFLRGLRESPVGGDEGPSARSRARLVLIATALGILTPIAAVLAPAGPLSGDAGSPQGLRIVALDVGQGDAILIQDANESFLVDTGPPAAGIVTDLRRYGVRRLAAVFITHTDLDHIGGLGELLDAVEIGHIFHADPLPPAYDRGSNRSPTTTTLAAGQGLRFGETVIDVLWPPRSAGGTGGETNTRSLVLLLDWRGFRALLTGDAEAEAATYSPGDIDLLKVAHHGSADRSLPDLLARTTPELALISAGRDNRHGHPHPSTLRALRAAGAHVHRTDLEGDLIVELPDSDHR